MNRYLVIAPHTAGDCKKAIMQVEAAGYLTHFDWGCGDGEHCGWVIIEASNRQEALLVVPSFNRPTAKAILLGKFTPEQVKKMHLA